MPGAPFFICQMRLIHMDTGLEIPDDSVNWEWLERGRGVGKSMLRVSLVLDGAVCHTIECFLLPGLPYEYAGMFRATRHEHVKV